MRNWRRTALDIGVAFVVMAASVFGLFNPLDNALRNLRFEASSRPATGGVVFLAIDPESLEAVGTWPWPRSVHAQVVDELIAANASDILFDVDFSTASKPAEDAAFEKALERAGGYVSLAAFEQPASVSNEGDHVNLPLPRFRAHATVADVNVTVDPDGILRRYAHGARMGDDVVPSAASILAGQRSQLDSFRIDYGIDIWTIDIVSVADVLDGSVDPARLRDRNVVIGASALELRDNFAVPRYGVLPGPMVQILAAETLRQNRALSDHGLAGGLAIGAVIALGFLLVRWRAGLGVAMGAALAACIGAEALALWLQAGPGILVNTVTGDAMLGALAIVGYSRELDLRHLLLRKATRERDDTRTILDRVIADNFDGVLVVQDGGYILTASRFAETCLGFSMDDAGEAGMHVSAILPTVLAAEINVALRLHGQTTPEPQVQETRLRMPDGAERIIEYVITLSTLEPESDDADRAGTAVACLTFRDVTDRRMAEKHLSYLAAHDPMTGALSRNKLIELIASTLEMPEGRGVGMTIALVDLSRFRVVNDTLGHAAGDELLNHLVERLRAADVDCVARMGGDTFALARAGILTGDALDAFGTDMIARIAAPYTLGERRAIVGTRMGVTTTAKSGFEPDILIAHADMALSAAKGRPVNGYAVYTADMDARLRNLQEMEVALRHAIAADAFHVLYQPQVDLDDEVVVGAEALVRWHHPELGMIPPDRFIPLAEETGLILELSRWVLQTACKKAAAWPRDITLAVNVSPIQFELGEIVEEVRHALETSGLPAERLDIEITESLFISQPDLVNRKLRELKAMGVGVALDDFGTGYSSLSYLGRLPIDKIKIDRAFIKGLPQDQHSAGVIRAVMTLSESLGKVVIAEGIENADQAWMLRLAGCHVGQGYYYDKPLENADITRRLTTVAKARAAVR